MKKRLMRSQRKMKKNRKLVEKTVSQMQKQKKDQSHARTAIKTVMFLFMKTKMKKLEKEIKEKGWVEYIKRSTKEAGDQMNRTRIPCWIETWKNEVENGMENSNSFCRSMVEENF